MNNDNKNTNAEPTTEQIEKWKAAHGKVIRIAIDEDEAHNYRTPIVLIAKRPSQPDLNRFAEMSMKGKTLKALAGLVEAARLYPDADTLQGWFRESPGLAMSLGNQVFKLTGGSADFSSAPL
jgi:hypothetical protein